MSDADRTTFLTELTDADNATASFILNGAQGENVRKGCHVADSVDVVLFKFGHELILAC